MINLALARKTFADSRLLLALCATGVVGFTMLFVIAMQQFAPELMRFLSQFEFLYTIFEAAFGIQIRGQVSMPVIWSVAFTHGVLLAITWSLLIATATRVTVGEVERGTADLLLSLPISRGNVYVSTSLVLVLLAAAMSCCPLVGLWLAGKLFELNEPMVLPTYYSTAANFFCFNVAISGIAAMVSALLSRRGMAIAIVIIIVLGSSVLNFAMPFFERGQWLKYFGLLEYFRPADCVRATQWPWKSMAVLLSIGIVCWLSGLWQFRRRDIPVA